ncbi:MAG TPA: AbrB/MazE/SpoVT family DNA-binding domain-containing protein [Tepidisphaeraceae bacterium]|nr:AbrB/MazE/SpoVT family DNA-binding domain-containing protein [Tepidisphaeraceae bacterium]
MATTIQKWGNSLGIRVPKSIAEQVKFDEGTEVEFETSNGVLTVRPRRQRRRKYKLSELLAKAKGASPYRDWARERPVGRELI